jgi:hypothetical protein
MACRGICLRYKAQKPAVHAGRYITGQKRCQVCETYIQWNKLWCPCCGYRLRTKPRNSKNKTLFRVKSLSNLEAKTLETKIRDELPSSG